MMNPTSDDMIRDALADVDRASAALNDAADRLRSDWIPVGSPLSDEQADIVNRLQIAIAEALDALNRGRR